ncbi:hypothetical protein N0V93_003750 [Gnomoniopsis smithogilvyi]|uniref:Uncharacterized protein n=1 Tax=Gnomoniopsis smithogilvyi TaxID=1191159 RepID=A0A9W8YZA7_9PEZI|nr:hypothetical protein N0V93_003750 [Gnomoniopsis smithogilvyi]
MTEQVLMEDIEDGEDEDDEVEAVHDIPMQSVVHYGQGVERDLTMIAHGWCVGQRPDTVLWSEVPRWIIQILERNQQQDLVVVTTRADAANLVPVSLGPVYREHPDQRQHARPGARVSASSETGVQPRFSVAAFSPRKLASEHKSRNKSACRGAAAGNSSAGFRMGELLAGGGSQALTMHSEEGH